MLSLDNVTKTLSEFYALSHETASQWAAFFVNKNMGWNHVHALTNMAIYLNTDVEDVWRVYESWRTVHEKDSEDSS